MPCSDTTNANRNDKQSLPDVRPQESQVVADVMIQLTNVLIRARQIHWGRQSLLERINIAGVLALIKEEIERN